jgi:hypothetical protein
MAVVAGMVFFTVRALLSGNDFAAQRSFFMTAITTPPTEIQIAVNVPNKSDASTASPTPEARMKMLTLVTVTRVVSRDRSAAPVAALRGGCPARGSGWPVKGVSACRRISRPSLAGASA